MKNGQIASTTCSTLPFGLDLDALWLVVAGHLVPDLQGFHLAGDSGFNSPRRFRIPEAGGALIKASSSNFALAQI
jgi:hypothetical protein